MGKILNTEDIIKKIQKAEHVIVDGAAGFDFWDELIDNDWFAEKIADIRTPFVFEIFCENKALLNSMAQISENGCGGYIGDTIGDYDRKNKEVYVLRKYLVDYLSKKGIVNCIEPFSDQVNIVIKKLKSKETDNSSDNEVIALDDDIIKLEKLLTAEDLKSYDKLMYKYNICEQRFMLRILHTPSLDCNIKIVTKVKGQPIIEMFNNLRTTQFINIKQFVKLEVNDFNYNAIESRFMYLNNINGGIKHSTEETAKGDKLETILAYLPIKSETGEREIGREPVYQFPRKAFNENVTQKKLVVWGFLFTHDGRMLLHKRGKNAADNRNMWDKSVGGHVAPDDIDTVKAFAREMAEELYTHEMENQGGHNKTDFVKINPDKIFHLGEWQLDPRLRIDIKELLKRNPDQYFFYRLDYNFSRRSHPSPRHLPNGNIVDVDTYVDVYFGILSNEFDIKSLSVNSKFMLKKPKEILSYIAQKKDNEGNEFISAPDFNEMKREGLWDKLVEISEYLQKKLS